MRVLLAVVLLLAGLGAIQIWKPRSAAPRPVPISLASLHASYLRGVDSLDVALGTLALLPPRTKRGEAQAAFRRARAAYKRIEYLVEFHDAFKAIALNYAEGPYWGLALNGPPLPIVDENDRANLLPPTGFQVIESALFPEPAPDSRQRIADQVEEMQKVLALIRAEPAETLEGDRRALDAARLEVARVATLGVAGFDATVSGNALRESADALRGVKDGLIVYEIAARTHDPEGWNELGRSLTAAIAYLEQSPSFDQFDRLAFIAEYVKPLTDRLQRMERELKLPPSRHSGAWAAGAMNLYDRGAIASRWFAPDYAPASTPEILALGRTLFFDPVLSSSGRRACSTCHSPSRAFTDSLALAAVDPGHGVVRNTPTLINAGLQAFQFADQRVRYLEFQVEEVMQNPREMSLPVKAAALKLRGDTALVTRFAKAMGRPKAQALTGQTLTIAIAAFVRSLEAMNSRFDGAVQGNTAALSASERRGFNLFMGKAKCGTCHFPPLFGGTTPPSYLESEPEVIGVPAQPLSSRRPTVDPDLGVFGVDRVPLHRHAFKTPNLRNVELTAPYMHNGIFRTLDEVVDFYDAGGGNGLGMRLPNQTLPSDSLHLSPKEKEDLVNFMFTLTDTSYVMKQSSDSTVRRGM